MRLIDTTMLELHEFFDDRIPYYAIVSHTWGDQEITLQDWLYVQNQNPPRWGWVQNVEEIELLKSREGYVKIINACRQAQRNNFEWIWVDTICIDKTSSAELSEAINSMFKWYMNAGVCYAFLTDVPPLTPEECNESSSPFRRSRWFKRGWTLQELIGPEELHFYSNDWSRIGSKKELIDLVVEITTVPRVCVMSSEFLPRYAIGARMSWASKRETSRAEDMAYCLLGIFGIHMPLLYGEGGENVFFRLQEELIKEYTDPSLFAWRKPLHWFDNSGFQPSGLSKIPLAWGVLATHPSQFEHVGLIRRLGPGRTPYSITSRGLRIQIPILEWNGKTLAILECGLEVRGSKSLGVIISRTKESFEDGEVFARTPDWNVYHIHPSQAVCARARTIYLLKRDVYRSMELPELPKMKDENLKPATVYSFFPDLDGEASTFWGLDKV